MTNNGKWNCFFFFSFCYSLPVDKGTGMEQKVESLNIEWTLVLVIYKYIRQNTQRIYKILDCFGDLAIFFINASNMFWNTQGSHCVDCVVCAVNTPTHTTYPPINTTSKYIQQPSLYSIGEHPFECICLHNIEL